MDFGCIGMPLSHSFSKEIHAAFAPYDYTLRELTPQELPAFLAERAFRAVNVTIPYKQIVCAFLNEISPEAEKIGAVNTILNRDGVLYGDNTDYYGLCALLRREGISLLGKKVAVLGSGGTAATARAVAADLGASEIICVSRTPRGRFVSYSALYTCHSDTKLLINATPVGMYPDTGKTPVSLDKLPALEAVVDVVYHPLRTALVTEAGYKGIKAVGGLYMLVSQAARASALFTGSEISPDRVEDVYSSLLQQKENVVLIGMPGCGKTSVGRLLADLTNKSFLDTDTMIAEKAGRSVPEILREDGEDAFRALEEQAIFEASKSNGTVIATGGGAVLRKSNLLSLEQNGKIVFLDRPLSALVPTPERPLSADREKLRTLFRERYDLYCHAASVHISVLGSEEQAVKQILEAIT